jgi:hypothetical protein
MKQRLNIETAFLCLTAFGWIDIFLKSYDWKGVEYTYKLIGKNVEANIFNAKG